jgi:hypothetical protein
VSGSLASAANTTFRIEFFASPAGNDEGQYFVGSANVVTNGVGTATFSGGSAVHLTAAVPSGYVITATATDPNGNTSQFSAPQTVTSTDTDGDGMPDNWMIAHWGAGHPTGQAGDKSRASDDADGDGLTNLQEFRAGTDPKDPKSVFRISSVAENLGSVQLAFDSVLGKTYRLEYRDDWLLGSWLTMEDQISGTGASLQLIDPSAAGVTKRFYRLSIEP